MKTFRIAAALLLMACTAHAYNVTVTADTDTGAVSLPKLEARIGNWHSLTGVPTTVSGYGISDAATIGWVGQLVSDAIASLATTGDLSSITNEPLFMAWTNEWHTPLTAHITNTVDNPHGITTAMIGAVSSNDFTTTISGYMKLTNSNWIIQQSSTDMAFRYGTTDVVVLSYGESDTPYITAASTSTNPPSLTLTFDTIGYTNRLELAPAPSSTNDYLLEWSEWTNCAWSYTGRVGTVIATNIDLDSSTWARIVSLSGIILTNPYVRIAAPMYIGNTTGASYRVATFGDLANIDEVADMMGITDTKVDIEQYILASAQSIYTNEEGGIYTNVNLTPGESSLAWHFNSTGGYVYVKTFSVSNFTLGTNAAITNWDTLPYSPVFHNHDWSSVTGRPTSLAGYGITNAYDNSVPITNSIDYWARTVAAWASNNFTNVWAKSDSITNATDANAWHKGDVITGAVSTAVDDYARGLALSASTIANAAVQKTDTNAWVTSSHSNLLEKTGGTMSGDISMAVHNILDAGKISADSTMDSGNRISFLDGEIIGNWAINGSLTLGGVLRTNWPDGGTGTGTGWTNLAFSGTGNAITGATAAANTLTLQRGEIEGGTGTADATGLPSILVSADWTWTNAIYAVGADTSSTNIAVTLPDAGTNFASVVIRKFSNLNTLTIMRGTNTVYTLYDDGSTRSYDWWPQRTNWYWRN